MGGSKWVTPLQKWDLSPLAQDMVDSWNGPSSPGQPSPATRSTHTTLGWLGVRWGNSEGWKPLKVGGSKWVTPLQKWDLSPLAQDMVNSWNGPSSPVQPSPATRSTLTSLGWLGVLWGNSEGWKPLKVGGPEWVTPLQKWDLSPLPQDMVHSWNGPSSPVQPDMCAAR